MSANGAIHKRSDEPLGPKSLYEAMRQAFGLAKGLQMEFLTPTQGFTLGWYE